MLVEATLRSFFGLFLFAFPLVFALMLLPSSSSLSESFNSSRRPKALLGFDHDKYKYCQTHMAQNVQSPPWIIIPIEIYS